MKTKRYYEATIKVRFAVYSDSEVAKVGLPDEDKEMIADYVKEALGLEPVDEVEISDVVKRGMKK